MSKRKKPWLLDLANVLSKLSKKILKTESCVILYSLISSTKFSSIKYINEENFLGKKDESESMWKKAQDIDILRF